MIKNTDSWNAIHKRICALPDSGSFYCRYTYGELKLAAGFNSDFFMQFTPAQIDKFNSKFNQLEMSLIQQIGSSTRTDKLQGIEQRVKSMTQRTQRNIESVALDLDFEVELQEIKDAHQSKRLKPTEITLVDQWKKLQAIF